MKPEQHPSASADTQTPEEVRTNGLIHQAFELFSDHFKSLANSVASFNKKREEVQEKLRRGAKQTDGRIV